MHSYRSSQVGSEQYCLLSCFFLAATSPQTCSCPIGWAGGEQTPEMGSHLTKASRGGGCQQSCCWWKQGWNGPQGASTLLVLPEGGHGRTYHTAQGCSAAFPPVSL